MQITVNTRRERGIFDEGTSCNNNYRGWGRVRVARDECLRRLMARKEFDVVDTVFCLFFLTSKTLSILLFNFYKNLRWSIKEGFGDFWNWDTCIWKILFGSWQESSIPFGIFRVSVIQRLTHESRFLRTESTVGEQRDEKSGTRRFNVPFNKRITKSNREFVWRVWSKIRLLRLISC